MNHIPEIPPSVAKNQMEEFAVLDVRTPAEFEGAHIEGSALCPVSELNPGDFSGILGAKKKCLLVCGSGKRAGQAAQKLSAVAPSSLIILAGGISAWEQEGLPLVRGRKAMSLERQVRIAAGCLVLTGVLLAYFVNPFWMLLSGFVGAGLVFAGITDTCGMGMLLARMPWNHRKG